jgi:signal transduction histidine kinase
MDAASRTAGALAHEIANYLGTMRTTLYLLADELGTDPEAKQDFDVVVRTVDDATRFVEALRGFANPQPLGQGPANLNAVLQEAEPAMRALMRPGATVSLSLAAPLEVRGDAPRLRQLALDLVAGAAHALMEDGRVEIETARAPDDAPGVPSALLVVRDNGPGLEPQQAARIFEPFVFDEAFDAGLRLPTVYTTVARSGGTITAESSPGAGTTIRVTLPLGARPAREPVRAP